FTVLVEVGRLPPDLGSKAQVNSSSPQKSRSFRKLRLKNPLLPPSVVILSSRPRMMKTISSTGSPSLRIYVFSVKRVGFSRSQIASSNRSSIFSNRGTCRPRKESKSINLKYLDDRKLQMIRQTNLPS
ncbi:hypothetical protein MUK42_37649, partial [Musa troglodytarum]